jgi:hypothetical protein
VTEEVRGRLLGGSGDHGLQSRSVGDHARGFMAPDTAETLDARRRGQQARSVSGTGQVLKGTAPERSSPDTQHRHGVRNGLDARPHPREAPPTPRGGTRLVVEAHDAQGEVGAVQELHGATVSAVLAAGPSGSAGSCAKLGTSVCPWRERGSASGFMVQAVWRRGLLLSAFAHRDLGRGRSGER